MARHDDDSVWRERLTTLEYQVLRQAATERPGTGEYLYEDRPGTYYCKGCGQALFDASTKFDAGCGWPSFFENKPGAVTEDVDYVLGYPRTEIRCANCGSHLGHVFPDAPHTPTGLRYCMNSVALSFVPDDEAVPPADDVAFQAAAAAPSDDLDAATSRDEDGIR